MRFRTLIFFSTLCVIGATAGAQTLYCYGDDVCDTRQPLPTVRDRHLIRVPPAGPCLLDSGAVPCSELGAKLRAAYPASNPQIGLCSDRETSFARIIEVQRSLGEARLLCLDFDCGPNSVEWAPACRDLPVAPFGLHATPSSTS